MLMCDACWQKEQQLKAENFTPEKQQSRVTALNRAMEAARKIDADVTVSTDLFNAATVAIVDLKKAIDENPEITNKAFFLAKELTTRFNHFRQVIFEAQATISDAANNQRAIQSFLNTFSNQLRAEEREELKLQDINYQPKPPKTVKPATVKTRKSSKLDKAELAKYAKELQVSEFTLQMLCVSGGLTPEAAANKLRKSIKEAISEATPDNEAAVDMGTEAE